MSPKHKGNKPWVINTPDEIDEPIEPETTSEESKPVLTKKLSVVVSGTKLLNIRSQPSINSSIVMVASEGMVFEKKSGIDGWVELVLPQVVGSNSTGYAIDTYLEDSQ